MPEDVPSIEVADDGLLIWRDGAYALGARTIEARGIAPAAALAGPWQVVFPPNLGAPAAITLERLGRAEERCVGEACVSECGTLWAPERKTKREKKLSKHDNEYQKLILQYSTIMN